MASYEWKIKNKKIQFGYVTFKKNYITLTHYRKCLLCNRMLLDVSTFQFLAYRASCDILFAFAFEQNTHDVISVKKIFDFIVILLLSIIVNSSNLQNLHSINKRSSTQPNRNIPTSLPPPPLGKEASAPKAQGIITNFRNS